MPEALPAQVERAAAIAAELPRAVGVELDLASYVTGVALRCDGGLVTSL